MKKDSILHIRVSEWMLGELRRRSKLEDKSLTEYVEGVIEGYWDRGHVGINPLAAEKFTGTSATEEYQKKLALGKWLIDGFSSPLVTEEMREAQKKMNEKLAEKLELGKKLTEQFNKAKAVEKVPVDEDEEEKYLDDEYRELRVEYDVDVPLERPEEASQVRVVGRHKK